MKAILGDFRGGLLWDGQKADEFVYLYRKCSNLRINNRNVFSPNGAI